MESKKKMENDKVKVIGIDPGTNHLGISCLDDDYNIHLYSSINFNSTSGKFRKMVFHDKVPHIVNSISNIFKLMKPDHVFFEDAHGGSFMKTFTYFNILHGIVRTLCILNNIEFHSVHVNAINNIIPIEEILTKDPIYIDKLSYTKTGRCKIDRDVKKAITIRKINSIFNIKENDDNICDSLSICLFGLQSLSKKSNKMK